MSYYGGTVTVAGRDLITSLMAGETIEFTRIMVGKGEMPEGVEPIDMTDLVDPVAEGVSTVPTVDNGVLYMTVEYRNDLNGGLKEGFWLREFGVYAKTEKTEEVLLYYATLGDSPQPVNAYQDNRIDIRRYPISIALEIDADVEVTYNPGAFITAQDAQTIIEKMVRESIYAVCCSVMTIITIPSSGWAEVTQGTGAEDDDDYKYYIDVAVEGMDEQKFPIIALPKPMLGVARKASMCPSVESLEGKLRFWSVRIPEADISAQLEYMLQYFGMYEGAGSSYVLPVATATTLGGVKIGAGVKVGADGTITVDADSIVDEGKATTTETDQMLDEVFPDEDGE